MHFCVHICVTVFVNERRLPLVVVGLLLLIAGPARNNGIYIYIYIYIKGGGSVCVYVFTLLVEELSALWT